MTNTPVTKYSRPIRILHWLLAIILIALFVAGTVMHNTADEALKFAVIKVHAPLGLVAGLLLFARTYFAFAHAHPEPDPNWSAPIKWGSKIIHILLYVLPLALVGSGIGIMALSGLGEILQSGQTAPWPDMANVSPASAHGLFAKLFLASMVLHIAGAVYHQAIVKDNLIARMMPGK